MIMSKSYLQDSIHSTICTDLIYNTVYIVQCVQISCTKQFTMCSVDLMYNTVHTVQAI